MSECGANYKPDKQEISICKLSSHIMGYLRFATKALHLHLFECGAKPIR
jgi:hypothetical protein